MSDPGYETNELVHRALAAAVADYGDRALSTPQVLRNVFDDYLPDNPRLVDVLTTAAEEGVATTLSQHLQRNMDIGTAVQLTTSTLQDRRALDPTASAWAVVEFARAMGHPVPELPPPGLGPAGAAGPPTGSRGQPGPSYPPPAGFPGSPSSPPGPSFPSSTPPPGPGFRQSMTPGSAPYPPAGGPGQPSQPAPSWPPAGGPSQPSQPGQPAPSWPPPGGPSQPAPSSYPPSAASQPGPPGFTPYSPPTPPPPGGPARMPQPPTYIPPGGGTSWPPSPPGGPTPPPPPKKKRNPAVFGGLAVVLLVVVYFGVAAAAKLPPFSNSTSTTTPLPPPTSTSPTTGGGGGMSLQSLLPDDVSNCMSFTPPAGLESAVAKQVCDDAGLGQGAQVYGYQFSSNGAYEAAFLAYNNDKNFDQATAGSSCPPSSTSSEGQDTWHDKAGATGLLECLSVTGTATNTTDPVYIWTIPADNIIFEAIGPDGSSFKALDTWWTNHAQG